VFLLRTVQLALLRFVARLLLVHLIAKALHRLAQVLVLPAHRLMVGVEFGEEGDFVQCSPMAAAKTDKMERTQTRHNQERKKESNGGDGTST
jgi:hypothetical protein